MPAFRRRQLDVSCRNSEQTGMAEESTAWPPKAMEILLFFLTMGEGGEGEATAEKRLFRLQTWAQFLFALRRRC